MPRVKYDFNVDLDLSMFPSFASVMFKQVGRNEWIKIYGYGKGTRLIATDECLICDGPVCDDEEVISWWCGGWHDPLNETRMLPLPSEVRDLLVSLVHCVSGLRLIVSPKERLPVLLATFLSRRTDYHVNVVRWVQEILNKCIDRGSGQEGLSINEECIERVGSSYQLKQLKHVIYDLLKISHAKIADPWIIRRKLLNVKYVGPKVADSYLLFTSLRTEFTPADIHFLNFLSKFNLIKHLPLVRMVFTQPSKGLCLKYGPTCTKCALRLFCITGSSISFFGKLSGYVQTLAYVVDKLMQGRAINWIQESKRKEILRCIKSVYEDIQSRD